MLLRVLTGMCGVNDPHLGWRPANGALRFNAEHNMIISRQGSADNPSFAVCVFFPPLASRSRLQSAVLGGHTKSRFSALRV